MRGVAAIAAAIAGASGATTVRPFDDSWIMAGQGTAGLEAALDAQKMGVRFDSLICNASGGGLLAGMAVAFEGVSPETEVYVAEPDGHDDLIRSLAAKQIVNNAPGVRSIAESPRSPQSTTAASLAGGEARASRPPWHRSPRCPLPPRRWSRRRARRRTSRKLRRRPPLTTRPPTPPS